MTITTKLHHNYNKVFCIIILTKVRQEKKKTTDNRIYVCKILKHVLVKLYHIVNSKSVVLDEVACNEFRLCMLEFSNCRK